MNDVGVGGRKVSDEIVQGCGQSDGVVIMARLQASLLQKEGKAASLICAENALEPVWICCGQTCLVLQFAASGLCNRDDGIWDCYVLAYSEQCNK